MTILLRNMAEIKDVPKELKLDILSRYAYTGKDGSEVTNYLYKDSTIYLPPNQHKLQVVSAILNREIIDERSSGSPLSEPFVLREDFQFRKHQVEPTMEFLSYIKQHHYGVLEAPCSSGKTVILAYCAGQLQKKTLVVVDLDIYSQWRFAFDVTYGKPVQQLTGNDTKFSDCCFATLQLLYRNPELLSRIREEFGTLLYDELHSIGQSESYKHVIYRLSNLYRLGTTATFNSKNFPIEILMDTISDVSVKMTQTDAMIPDVYFIRTGVAWCSNDPYEIQKIHKELTENKHRHSMVLSRIVRRVNEGYKVIFVANSTAQCKELYKQLKELPQVKPALFISGSKLTIEELNLQWESDKLNVILTCKRVERAVDLPSADCMVIARLYNNENTVQQLRGRVERFKEGKKTPILDVFIDTAEEKLDNIWTKPYEKKTLAEVFAWKHRRWHQNKGCKIIEED